MTREIFQALETDAAVPSMLRQMLHIYRTNAEQGTWPEAAREWQQVAEGVIEIRDHGDPVREFDDLYNHWLPIMGRHCINETKPSAPVTGPQGVQAATEDLTNPVWQLRITLLGLITAAQGTYTHVLRGSKLDKSLRDIIARAAESVEQLNELYPLPPEQPGVRGGPHCTGSRGPQGCLTPPEGQMGVQGEDYNPLINEATLRPVDRVVTGKSLPLPGGPMCNLDCRHCGLYQAVVKHHADRGNDRCWENDVALYVAAGLEPGDPQLPSYEEHCRKCEEYRNGLYGLHTPPPAGNTLPS